MNTELLELITQWVNNIAYFVLWIFGTVIISRLLSRIVYKILDYFKYPRASIVSEVLEYGIYVISLGIVLAFAGIFTISLIVLGGIITILIIVSLINFLISFFRNMKYYNALKRKRPDKKYLLGRLHTTEKLTNDAKIIYPNKYLFQYLNR